MKALGMIATLVLALGAGAALSSCESLRAKPGVDGTAYSIGHLDAMVHASPPQVVTAASSVLEEMQINVQSKASSGVDGQVIGRTALDKRIEITVERQDQETSKVSILVGSWGEESLSREIYEKIKAKL